MLLSEVEVNERIESPFNLINRLKALTTPSSDTRIPSLPPTADQVVKDLDEKLGTNSIKGKASAILVQTLDELKMRLPELDKADKLSRVAESMVKVIDSVSPKDKGNTNNIAQVVIYSPRIRREEEFDVIDIQRIED